MTSRVSMKVPTSSSTSPGPVERAAIALELTRNQEFDSATKAIQAIHETADDRGKQMVGYMEYAKEWIKDMKAIAGS